jgi:NAD+-dependent secondary alcohol dehydrogenase Adh1
VLDFVAEQGAENDGFTMTRPAGSYFVIGYGGTLTIPTLDIISTERNIIGNIVGTYNDLAGADGAGTARSGDPAHQELSLDAATDGLHELDAGNVRGRAILVPKAAPYPERQILIRLSRRCSQLHELARVS